PRPTSPTRSSPAWSAAPTAGGRPAPSWACPASIRSPKPGPTRTSSSTTISTTRSAAARPIAPPSAASPKRPSHAPAELVTTLRPYRDDDQDVVVKLWWDSWHSIRPGLRHPRPFEHLRSRWVREIVPHQRIMVVADEGAVVGFAAADLGKGVLTQIFVAPTRKGQGIGHQLFQWAQTVMPHGFILHTMVD